MKLSECKVGDFVILSRGPMSTDSVEAIERVTPTKIVVNGQGFKTVGGQKKGKRIGYCNPWIRVPIEGEIEEIRAKNTKARLVREMEAVKWANLPLEMLESIKSALLEHERRQITHQ